MKMLIVSAAAVAALAVAASYGRDQSCVRQAPTVSESQRSHIVVG